jgi:hypothetical protein
VVEEAGELLSRSGSSLSAKIVAEKVARLGKCSHRAKQFAEKLDPSTSDKKNQYRW